MADKYGIPVHVREGKSRIMDDWNFAYHMADSRFVTIAHQDYMYQKDYGKLLLESWKRYPDMTLFTGETNPARYIYQSAGFKIVKTWSDMEKVIKK